MAQIGSLKGQDGLNVYPGTIPQAVIDPSTKKNLRTELDELYNESIVMEEDETDVPDVETVAADTSTKALQDWDGNDIRTTYLKITNYKEVSVDSSMSASSTNPVQNKVVKAYVDGKFAVVTEAQYTALGSKVNSDGVIYFITE